MHVKGRDCVISVPLGTIIRTNEGLLLGELLKNGQTLQVAKGGRGGRGNRAFRSSIMKCPKICEDGEKTSEEWIQVELKIVADVGLVGVPNAGKSSLLAAVSEAHPKIANYSFSTTSPNLGVCSFPEVISRGGGRSIVISDIPGLICGAHKGVGLGLAFLRHIERCKILLHIIDGNSVDPLKDFQSIQKELSAYSPDLLQKPQILAVNKIDLPHVGAVFQNLKKNLQTAAQHTRIVPISGTTLNLVFLWTSKKNFKL
ncbi:hypothetical protein IE077_004406 [Cardiosporidium cionae]|uniref:Uncharacterized protein n=1 Tax=Cardiosporidium cionae TaxID=476202 RepID=A0ABQ7JFM8_9APIC|nr:hypothetical protein IE077_004406 [Cardiosporidium cionae]|eukprot:KAF8822792.1 hypothetical protein IE077_004406 [Cardiosporidium cionae]